MLKTCENFADQHNIEFSTDPDPTKSKSKAVYVTGPRGGARKKQAQFIDSSVKIQETFGFAHPVEQVQAVEKYCTSVYGSNPYDFKNEEFEMICSAWKTSIKLALSVHSRCHTYLLQQVLAQGRTSLRVNLLLRFRTFFWSLLTSPSLEIQVAALLAARDMRSSIGSNLALIRQESGGLDPWTVSPGQLKAALVRAEEVAVPLEDAWRVSYLYRLLTERLQHFYSGGKQEEDRVRRLIDSLVLN